MGGELSGSLTMTHLSAWTLAAALVWLMIWPAAIAAAGDPVALRIESLLVAPAHTPSAVVVVKNLMATDFRGSISLEGPEGWAFEPAEQPINLPGEETHRVRFLVRRAMANEENCYVLTATAIATGSSSPVVHQQQIAVASAPYFRPAIDGDAADWKDAIPVTWATGGLATSVSTFWNRKSFSILVAVEEKDWIAGRPASGVAVDAVQIAISPPGAVTGSSADAPSTRLELLLMGDDARRGRCFLLAKPGMKLAETQTDRELESLACQDVELVVTRDGSITRYECAIPFQLFREQIRPSEGREFQLSVLVHDPDGTGIRDWGEAAGLWPWQRNRLAWSRWPGAKWGPEPPLDCTTPWGMCSSKY